MILRRETPRDHTAIREVHTAAFQRAGEDISAEARLVDDLRADGDMVPGLSIVAIVDGEIVGHVVCSRGDIAGQPALGLGPLGVLPRCQQRGVGHALMHGAVAAADSLDEACVVVLGDVSYYSRFGFEPASRLAVLPEDPAWVEHFQLRRLTAWRNDLHGVFRYAPAFRRL